MALPGDRVLTLNEEKAKRSIFLIPGRTICIPESSVLTVNSATEQDGCLVDIFR